MQLLSMTFSRVLKMPANRGKDGKFLPGNKANPSGRPKENPEVKEILKAASPDAARVLVGLLDSKKDIMRFYAAQEILNRTQGKPIQAQEINLQGNLDVRGQVRALLQERLNERRRVEEANSE